jgi:hypothetical protein
MGLQHVPRPSLALFLHRNEVAYAEMGIVECIPTLTVTFTMVAGVWTRLPFLQPSSPLHRRAV